MEPLVTLAEQLSEPSKKNLDQAAKAAFSRAPIQRRAGWWFEANAGKVLLAAVSLGLLTGFVVARKVR